jgi:hypothetical protein
VNTPGRCGQFLMGQDIAAASRVLRAEAGRSHDAPNIIAIKRSFWAAPFPIPDLGHVLAVFINVLLVFNQLVPQLLL